MTQLLKTIKALLAKGYATEAEKKQLAEDAANLKPEEREVIASDVEAVEALPAEPSTDGDVDEQIEKSIKSLLQTATNEIKTEVKSWLDEQKALSAKKAGVYHPEVATQRAKKNEFIREFAKALYSDDTDRLREITGLSQKELTTDATGSPYGGYVVDRELSAEIHHLVTQYGVARREMTTIQLSKNSYKANDLVTDVSVFWVDEGSVIKSTQVVLGQDSLNLKKLGAIVALTSELLEDQEIDLFSFIASRVAENLAKAEDIAFFSGDGSATYGGFTGLLTLAGLNEVVMAATKTAFTDLTADNLLDMQDATPTAADERGKYYMHRTIRSIVRKLKDTTNNYIYQAPGQGMPATIWDKPVVLVEAMPSKSATAANKAFVLYGDMKAACLFGYKGAISAKKFDAGVIRNVADNADINLITSDREAIRWTERVGYIAVIANALTRLKTAAS